MLYPNNRHDLRTTYFTSWQKYRQGLPLTALESQIVAVILDHPEYHTFFDNEEKFIEKEFSPETDATNPFLHMGLHLTIRDQIATNRPVGIKRVYRQLLMKYREPLIAEHYLMQVALETLRDMQKYKTQITDADYLRACKEFLK